MNFLKKTGCSIAILLMLSVILLGACSEEETPKETNAPDELLANIMNFELSTRTLTLDEVEWIEEADTERIKELGLDVEKDLPTGFTIYNESNEETSIKLAEDAELLLVNPENTSEPRAVDEKEFISYVVNVRGPYYITVEDDVVVKVEEKYMP